MIDENRIVPGSPVRAVMEELALWRDLIFMLLFTGQRKKNVCRMEWKDLDLDRDHWYVAGEQLKNGSPLVVVLSTQAVGILKSRLTEPDKNETWVFPSERSDGPVADPKKAWERLRERSGLTDVRMHDLRRTLGSWQALTGTSLLVIGKSLGQKSVKATEVYARLTTDPLGVVWQTVPLDHSVAAGSIRAASSRPLT